MTNSSPAYAGDLDVRDVWDLLGKEPNATLVDVRTTAEWSFVGLPDLRSVGKRPLLIEWQTYPAMAENAAFLDRLRSDLERLGVGPEDPVLFLCRSGARSRAAAIAATAAGFSAAYNVADGFEGPLGQDGRRGRTAGWKAAGLPWVQT